MLNAIQLKSSIKKLHSIAAISRCISASTASRGSSGVYKEPETIHRDTAALLTPAHSKMSYAVSESHKMHLLCDTIYDRLNTAVLEKPNNVCYKFSLTNTSITFSELKQRADQLAQSLLAMGYQKGDRLAVLLPNTLELTTIFLAASSIGVIVVLMNPAYQQIEIDYMLKKTTCKGVVIMDNLKTLQHYEILKKLCPEIDARKHHQEEINSKSMPHLKHVILVNNGLTPPNESYYKGTVPYKTLEKFDQENKPLPYIDFDDPAFILFTSGTTGNPKGAMLSHFNLVNPSYIVTYTNNLAHLNMINCCPIPIFHVFGLAEGALSPLVSGGQTVFPNFFPDTLSTMKAIHDEKCTALKGAPVIFNDLLNHPDRKKYDLSSLKYMIVGASTIPKDLMIKMRDILKLEHIIIGYGMTESSAGATATRCFFTEISEKHSYESVGKVFPFVECKIIDKEGKLLPHNQEGEICFRGYNVMKGYWDEPVKTAETIDSNGWLKTGDIGLMDENGVVYFRSREKELIIRGGVNIYPAEVESFIRTNDHVLDAYCFGIPDERTGEEVCLWVKLKPESAGKLTPESVKKFCEGKIAYYKIPKHVRFVDSFPISANGKAQKFKMVKEMLEILKNEAK